jgi:hypothetical protein
MSAISYQLANRLVPQDEVRRCVDVDLIGARVEPDPPTREEMLE